MLKKAVVIFALVSVGVISSKLCASQVACPAPDSLEPAARERILRKSQSLKELLPLEIDAIRTVQIIFQGIVDSKREREPLEAFRAACSLTNLQPIVSSTEAVLSCLKSEDMSVVSIGVGASPSIEQNISQLIVHLEGIGMDCSRLKEISILFKEITKDISNPSV
jgi:hypothetical protein